MRAQILDLVFDQSSNASLKLNIVRFNIGGSTGMNRHGESVDDEGFRSWGAIPSFIMPDGTYNWNADTAQVVVLQEAKARGANVFEAFSNSPPWWMTVSNTTRGAYYGTIDNIRPENYPAFAEYLATVVAHARDAWGITFDYLEPFNEPNSGWWKPEVSSQEGCEWSAKSQAAFIPFLVDAVRKAGLLPRLKVTASDIWSMESIVRNLQNGGWIEGVGKINVHGYAFIIGMFEITAMWWNSLRDFVSDRAGSAQELWMSEAGGFNDNGVRSAATLGATITQDLNILRASAWAYWQILDSSDAWTLMKIEPAWVWWAPSYPFRVVPGPMFYAMQQFTSHVRPGDAILRSSRSGFLGTCDVCVLAAYSSSDQRLTLVATNTDAVARAHRFLLDDGFASVDGRQVIAEAMRTNTLVGELFARVDAPALDQGTDRRLSLRTVLPALSITTLVVSGVRAA